MIETKVDLFQYKKIMNYKPLIFLAGWIIFPFIIIPIMLFAEETKILYDPIISIGMTLLIAWIVIFLPLLIIYAINSGKNQYKRFVNCPDKYHTVSKALFNYDEDYCKVYCSLFEYRKCGVRRVSNVKYNKERRILIFQWNLNSNVNSTSNDLSDPSFTGVIFGPDAAKVAEFLKTNGISVNRLESMDAYYLRMAVS